MRIIEQKGHAKLKDVCAGEVFRYGIKTYIKAEDGTCYCLSDLKPEMVEIDEHTTIEHYPDAELFLGKENHHHFSEDIFDV